MTRGEMAEQILKEAKALVALLEEPEYGLMTWNLMVGQRIEAIAKFASSPNRSEEP